VISFLFLLAGCQPFKSLEYRGLSDWDFQTKSFTESKLAVKVVVFNPNKHKIVVKRMEADIEVNGQKWSSYKMDSTFEVPGNAEFTFPVVLMVKNSYLISGMAGFASGKELPYLFKGKIKGMYRSITAEVPFNYKGTFSDKNIKL
jgi:LEA14-like dessication related protein